jgi:putative ABC transport system ATP-binding protein
MNKNTIPVKIENLTKTFGKGSSRVTALCDVSLTVNTGDFTAVMGASGSGKSTLLHLIAGLTPPDSGHIFVNGEDITKMSDRQLTIFRRRHVGLVFQAFNLIPSLTAKDNIILPAMSEKSTRETEQYYSDLVSRFGLESRIKHMPDALSGGEQQRVAIARSLIRQPTIVLADEPTGSLDSAHGQNLCKLLRELCDNEGRTIIMVTHEPAVAIWAKNIMVLKDGQFLDSFKPDFKDPHSLASHYQSIIEKSDTLEVSA